MVLNFHAPRQLTPEDFGQYDLGKAIRSGFDTFNKFQEARYKPKTLAENLLSSQLANKINSAKAKYAEKNEETNSNILSERLKELGITNENLPEKLKYALQQEQRKAEHPELSYTGGVGDLARLNDYASKNPDLFDYQSKQVQPSAPEEKQPELGQIPSYIASLRKPIEQPLNQAQEPSSQLENMRKHILSKLQGQSGPLTGAARDAQSLQMLGEQYGKDSEIYKDARKAYDAQTGAREALARQRSLSPLAKKLAEMKEVDEGFIPGTNKTQQFDSPEQRDAWKNALVEDIENLKKGQHYVYDPKTHERIGVKRPLDNEEKKVERGRIIFNDTFPIVNTGLSEFSGKDSIRKFDKYVGEYGKNPEATQKIDDLLLALKLTTVTAVNEQGTIGAGKTNVTYRALLNSIAQSDLPKIVMNYEKNFRLPAEANIKAGLRFQEILNRTSKKAASQLPAYKTEYFKPQSQNESGKTHYSDQDITDTAKKYNIGEEEVRRRIASAGGK